ncbi:hypothetical protein JYT34_01215 [Olleya sp. AH-315-K02]|nr:hypothetical protein [Olleya sp. AH-315-K02]
MNEHVQQKNWFTRNWLWVIPVGGCLTIICLFVFGVGAIFFGVTNVLKNSTPYEYSVELASNNSDVIQLLGEPIETHGIMSGNISIQNNSGEVDISIPIKGSKGKGTVIVIGEKIDGEWFYEELYVLIKETNEKINLLNKILEVI